MIYPYDTALVVLKLIRVAGFGRVRSRSLHPVSFGKRALRRDE